MIDFLAWYLFLLLLGWVCLPLTWNIFRALPSRGYFLVKPVGLLLWGYLFWLFGSTGLMGNTLAGQVSVLMLLIVINVFVCTKGRFKELYAWLKNNKSTILTVELVFFIAFAAWALIRAANPAIIGTEKPMEMAFINAILRSPSFPPNDPWLSGYGISYYYFGYVIAAMLIRITGVASGVGYNLVSSSWFGLAVIAVYGVLFDLLSSGSGKQTDSSQEKIKNRILLVSLAAPLVLLIVSNWHGFFDMLHARGLFWYQNAEGGFVSEFWDWLNLKELTSRPSDYSWFPTRQGGVQWWGASRVLQDFGLNGESLEVIDEFPMFSFLLSDIHPHVLGMPFVFLAISQALNAILGGWKGKIKVDKWVIPLAWPQVLFAAITLGGIAFLNTWDFPFYLVLIAAAISYLRITESGWNSRRIWEFLLLCLVLGVASILLYVPFYLSFSSQAGGILPSLAFFTRGVYFWIMFGPLLVPIIGLLLFWGIESKKITVSRIALVLTSGIFLLLFVLSWSLSFIATKISSLSPLFFNLQGADNQTNLLIDALLVRIKSPGTAVTLFLLLLLALSLLLRKKPLNAFESSGADPEKSIKADVFILLLIILGGLLALAPEFVYLRDQFGTRMNTIFKFYFQAWILWSVAASYALTRLGLAIKTSSIVDYLALFLVGLLGFAALYLGIYRDSPMFEKFNQGLSEFGSSALDYILFAILIVFIVWIITALIRKHWQLAFIVLGLLALGMGLIYPVVSLWNKVGGLKPITSLTLDGTADFREYWPDQLAAVDWLQKAPDGVLVEAVSPTGGSYTTYASVSTFSGMPTVLGWVGHVAQWRGGYIEMGSRQEDIRNLYSTRFWGDALEILDKYNIRYVYIGQLERNTYTLNEDKFSENLALVFESGETRIYEYLVEQR